MERNEVIERCFRFISGTGIVIREMQIATETFMPGITVINGELVVDKELMKYPGDLLHEAGHIAVTAGEERSQLNGDVTAGKEQNKGSEIGVLLWSYLAAEAAGVPAEAVFHSDGYKGDSDWLLDNFRNKKYIGMPLLEWMKIVKRKESGEPEIINWLRQ